MACLPECFYCLLFVVPAFYPIWPHLFVESVITVYGADSSGLFIEGYIDIIGIIKKTKILLKVFFSLLVTYNHHITPFAAEKGVPG